MEYIYAALLLHEVGKEINEDNMRKILEAAGAKIDEAKIKAISEALKNVNIEEVIKESQAVSFAPAQPQPEKREEKKEEEKKEEEKKEPSEEEIAAGLSALFGF